MRKDGLIGCGAAAAAALGLLVGAAAPAAAIHHGEPDGGEHAYVGLMVAEADGEIVGRCTGTLLSPTVLLTAGHCTDGADRVRVFFEEDLRDPEAVGYPHGGATSVEGRPATHPQYDPARFRDHDLGVVVLDEPVVLAEYGRLPSAGLFDRLLGSRARASQQFTAVGYGLQRNLPEPTGLTSAERVRLQATVRVIGEQVGAGTQPGASVVLSSNAAGGGPCNGDSGGPVLVAGTDVVAAVVSYSRNARCSGTAGGYRLDTADDLEWLAGFGVSPTS